MTAFTVVTPWHNASELGPAYWRAMLALGEGDRVVIVDNASVPSVSIPRDERFTVKRLKSNAGFSRASNIGLKAVETDAVVFLNNDVRMTSATWPQQIRQALKPGVLVGASLRSEPYTAVDGGKPIAYLDGWCVAGMTDEIRSLGGWDTLDEPSYWGDNILSVKAVAAGMKLVPVSVGLNHIGNYTSRLLPERDETAAGNRAKYEHLVRSLR